MNGQRWPAMARAMSEGQEDFGAAHLNKNLAPELLFAALHGCKWLERLCSKWNKPKHKARSSLNLGGPRNHSKPIGAIRWCFLSEPRKSTWVNKCQQHLMLASPKIMAYMAVFLACLKLIPHKYHSNGLRAGSQEYVLAKPKVNATPPKKRKVRCLSPA